MLWKKNGEVEKREAVSVEECCGRKTKKKEEVVSCLRVCRNIWKERSCKQNVNFFYFNYLFIIK